ncbi:hypothetical protein [Rhodopseudomonas sp.]
MAERTSISKATVSCITATLTELG